MTLHPYAERFRGHPVAAWGCLEDPAAEHVLEVLPDDRELRLRHYPPGPGALISGASDSILPSAVQMAPWNPAAN